MIQMQLLLFLEPFPQNSDSRIKIQIKEQPSFPLPIPKKLLPHPLEQLQLLSQPQPQELLQLLHKSLIVEPPKGFLFTLYLMYRIKK